MFKSLNFRIDPLVDSFKIQIKINPLKLTCILYYIVGITLFEAATKVATIGFQGLLKVSRKDRITVVENIAFVGTMFIYIISKIYMQL